MPGNQVTTAYRHVYMNSVKWCVCVYVCTYVCVCLGCALYASDFAGGYGMVSSLLLCTLAVGNPWTTWTPRPPWLERTDCKLSNSLHSPPLPHTPLPQHTLPSLTTLTSSHYTPLLSLHYTPSPHTPLPHHTLPSLSTHSPPSPHTPLPHHTLPSLTNLPSSITGRTRNTWGCCGTARKEGNQGSH